MRLSARQVGAIFVCNEGRREDEAGLSTFGRSCETIQQRLFGCRVLDRRKLTKQH